MLLHFVAGRAGSGKSTWIYQAVKKELAASSRPVYLVVPEQFTLQTEKELLESLGKKGFMQARVTSPTRLAEDVFAQVEQPRRTAIGKSGLTMALRAAALQIADQLHAFRPVLGFNGFSAGMVDLISEMKRFDIRPESLTEAAGAARGALKAKTEDIAALYRQYDGYLASRSYMDGDDRFNFFIDGICKAAFFRDAAFYFDGFDYLSPQNCRMIGQLLSVASSVTISQDMDAMESEDADLFAASRRNVARLSDIASELGAQVRWTHLRTGDRHSTMPPDIAHLERSLFAWGAELVPAQGGLTVCRAESVEEEAEAAAAWVTGKVAQEGLHWRQIAVQCADLAACEPSISRVFSRYGIPFFIDSKKTVADHPAVVFVLQIIKLIERSFRVDDALRLVKTGYSGISRGNAEVLEQYLTAFQPRGASTWAREWAKGQDIFDLAAVNRSRAAIVALTNTLTKAVGAKTAAGKQWAEALYRLLEGIKLDEVLDREALRLRDNGFIEEAAITERIWNSVLEALEQLHEMIGDEGLDAAGFGSILQSGFDSMELGILPTGVDQVQVGSMGRSKYSGLKYLLILGAADGSLTDAKDAGGVLSARDIDTLLSLGVELGRGSELKASQRRFSLYEAITKGSGGLYISWPAIASGSDEPRPDRIVERMMQLLSIGEDKVVAASDLIAQSFCAGGSFGRLPGIVKSACEGVPSTADEAALAKFYLTTEAYRGRAEGMLAAVAGDRLAGRLYPAAGMILSGVSAVSASQLESFGDCPYRHFVEYVLSPVQWLEHGVEASDAGRFLHEAMERFSRRLSAFRFDVSELDDGQARALMEREIADLSASFSYGLLNSTARLIWTGGNLGSACMRAAMTFVDQLRCGLFVPFGQEIRFGKGGIPAAALELADGSFTHLQGRIDRLDVCGLPDEDLLRVFDYKSGRAAIDLVDAVNGLDVQTWLYLYAIRAIWEKLRQRPARPAAALIFPLIDPWVEDGPEEETKRRKELRPRGWCVDDCAVLAAMDRTASGGKSALYDFGRSGKLGESVVNKALDLITDRARQSVVDIRRGCVEPYPWRSGKSTACAQCPYGALCRFELMERGKYRQLMDEKSVNRLLGIEGEAQNDGMDQ